MNKSLKKSFGAVSIGLIVGIGILLFAAFLIISFFRIGNLGAEQEALMEGTWRNNQQILSSCSVSIRNISKIPQQDVDQFNSILKTEMEGRYGGVSTERVAMFLKERALNYDNSMNKKIQNEILACETKFSLAQGKLISIQTGYEVMRNSAFTGAMLRANGYPKKDLNKFTIILDKSTQEQFQSGTRQDYDTGSK